MIKIFISLETEPCRYLFQSSPFSASILKPGFNLQEREKILATNPRDMGRHVEAAEPLTSRPELRALDSATRHARAHGWLHVGLPPPTPAPGLCPEPRRRAHLSLAELQHLGQTLPLGRREVFLGLKLLLQLDGLVVGEPDLAAFPFMQRPLQERAPEQGFACGQREQRLGTALERPGPRGDKGE